MSNTVCLRLFVAGGFDSDIILERSSSDASKSVTKVPYDSEFLRSMVYQKTDQCSKLCLTAPYTCKQLCEIP